MVFAGLKRQWAVLADKDQHQYTLLDEEDAQNDTRRRTGRWANCHVTAIRLASCGVFAILIIFFSTSFVRSMSTQTCNGIAHDRHCKKEVAHSWGQYSSSFSVPSEISPAAPQDCEITFAQLLARHGARDPTAHKSETYAGIIDRIHDSVTDYGKNVQFLKTYQYKLGADQLTSLGQRQMVESGIKFYRRYRQLANTNTPFIRASGQDRVVESAEKWAKGFHQARVADRNADPLDEYPYNILVIPEEDGFNNTLSPDICLAFEESRHDNRDEQLTWAGKFLPPLTERLNRDLPGANLTDQETVFMMDLCPFNTVADPRGELSKFCYVFTVQEWHDYDYYQSLGKWYGFGNGNPLGSTQGVGFINELLARLTGQPVVDHTSTNSTLDDSHTTFPLDKALYADFSHDNDMMGMFAALGLYNQTDPLPEDRRVSAREAKGFSASWVVPFAARLYVEKMACGGSREEFVRILVNDRVIPLQNCGADALGRCRLDRFVASQSFAKDGGLWDRCFA